MWIVKRITHAVCAAAMTYRIAKRNHRLTSLLYWRQWNRNSFANLDVFRHSCRKSSVGWVHGVITSMRLPRLQHLLLRLLWEFPRLAYGTLRDIARILRRSCGAVWIRLRFRKYEVDRRVGRMVHLALRAFVLAGHGTLEFMRDALQSSEQP